MKIKGRINSDFEPLIKIGLSFGNKCKLFNAVIDTGFNGFISIPHKIINQTSWQFIGYEEYELASGEIIKDNVYLGSIILGGENKYTYILSNKSNDILIGTKLLADKILSINFKRKTLFIKNA